MPAATLTTPVKKYPLDHPLKPRGFRLLLARGLDKEQ
jgi:hypothetical protein